MVKAELKVDLKNENFLVNPSFTNPLLPVISITGNKGFRILLVS